MNASWENTTSPMRSYFRFDEFRDNLLGCPQPARRKVRLPHAAGNVQRDGYVHPLAANTSLASLTCGLAAAIINRANATNRSAETNGSTRSRSDRLLPETRPGVRVPHTCGPHPPPPPVGQRCQYRHRGQQKKQPRGLEAQFAHVAPPRRVDAATGVASSKESRVASTNFRTWSAAS